MFVDSEGYTNRTYRIVYVFRIGWCRDPEGHTFGEIISEAKFPTLDKAELHREYHPDVFKDRWGQWRTKNPYQRCGIYTEKEEVNVCKIYAPRTVWE